MSKSVDSAEKKPPQSQRMIKWYLHYLRSCGFYPLADLLTGQSFSRLYLPYSCIIVVVSALFAAVDLLVWIAVQYRAIIRLEFFSMVMLLDRVFFTIHAPFAYIYMILQSKRIQHLVASLDRTTAKNRGAKIFAVLSIIWTEICPALSLIMTIRMTQEFVELLHRDTVWNHMDSFSLRVVSILNIVGNVVLGHANIAPHAFIATVVVIITIMFRRIHGQLRVVQRVGDQVDVEEKHAKLADAMTGFRKTVRVLREFNEIFGGLVLYSCVKDLLVIVAFIAFNLNLPVEREDGEDTVEYLIRKEGTHGSTAAYAYYGGATGIFMVVVRLAVFIGCSAQVRRISKTLEAIGDEHPDSPLDTLCMRFQQEIASSENVAVSAGGFFSVTKEYLITVTGAILSYFILIYQTRDQKIDMADLVKENVFKKEMDYMLRNITNLVYKLKRR
ncbi:uncharacterized protein LOC129588748 [Paramacrobiotus metropolitanus]|uniref:uncharacterized protein LOC129588748 n=1 Tax=Paramacrobiotus metropolitanus TaxID=2943436 RepID=UPI00244571A7|nr:uncharacterized protein LOC129588748 [Paramacrobiotus metropolitanus]